MPPEAQEFKRKFRDWDGSSQSRAKRMAYIRRFCKRIAEAYHPKKIILDAVPSKHAPGKTLLDETLVIAMSEFGRTPGPLSETRKGREHHMRVLSGMFAGGGVRRGAVIGKTDERGGEIVDYGWSASRPIYMEDVACTIYSALGVDWTKRIENTPSGRAFHYVEPASGTKYVDFRPAQELFA